MQGGGDSMGGASHAAQGAHATRVVCWQIMRCRECRECREWRGGDRVIERVARGIREYGSRICWRWRLQGARRWRAEAGKHGGRFRSGPWGGCGAGCSCGAGKHMAGACRGRGARIGRLRCSRGCRGRDVRREGSRARCTAVRGGVRAPTGLWRHGFSSSHSVIASVDAWEASVGMGKTTRCGGRRVSYAHGIVMWNMQGRVVGIAFALQ